MTASPLRATVLAVLFAETAALGGIVLSLAPGAPVSFFVTAISFAIYLTCRVVAFARERATRRIDRAGTEGGAEAAVGVDDGARVRTGAPPV